MIDLSIVIANYNTKQLLKNCLDSIFKYQGSLKFETIVVDNASTDGSVEYIAKIISQKSHLNLKLIKNKENLLYSKANNQGLRKAKAKYVLILNSDTVMQKDTLTKMKKFMDKHPNCGLSGCRQIDRKKKTLATSHRFTTPITEILELPFFRKLFTNPKILQDLRYAGWDRKDIRQVDTVPGSFLFGNRSVLKKHGFFDENMLLFYSDADLCKRVSDTGYEIWHNGEITITHFAAKSLEKFSLYKSLSLSYKDMVNYYRKHFGIFWASLLWFLSKLNLVYFALVSASELKRK